MARLIDADELIERCKKMVQDNWNNSTAPVSWAEAYATFIDDIETCETVPAYGQWIKTTENNPKLPDCECCKVTVITYRIGDTNTHPMIYERETVRGINVTRWKLLRNRLSDYVPDYWMSMP